jgi:hypothetical protein
MQNGRQEQRATLHKIQATFFSVIGFAFRADPLNPEPFVRRLHIGRRGEQSSLPSQNENGAMMLLQGNQPLTSLRVSQGGNDVQRGKMAATPFTLSGKREIRAFKPALVSAFPGQE